MSHPYTYTCSAILLLLLLSSVQGRAQTDTLIVSEKVTLSQYLGLVGSHNLNLAAARYQVSIAEAAIESAKVFPDPELSIGAYDNQEAKLHLGRGYNAGISATVELGGKRKARTALANSQWELSKAQFQDYLRNLRADAVLQYFNAMLQYHLLQVQQNAYRSMKQLADADAIRFKLGAITATDAKQSGLEAGNLLNDLLQAEADWKASLLQLGLNTGRATADTLLLPIDSFSHLSRNFSLPALISNACQERADALAAQAARTVADRSLQLAKANRRIDLGLSAGLLFSGVSTNEEAPTPAYRSISAGLSIPLKFSNTYKGEIKAARFTIKQTELQYEQVLLQVATEVTQAYFQYQTAEKQVQQFQSGLLTAGEAILEGKIYSYKRGQTSLLEVLNARRTYNEVQRIYYQALYGYAAALVALERSAGIWDLK